MITILAALHFSAAAFFLFALGAVAGSGEPSSKGTYIVGLSMLALSFGTGVYLLQ